MIAVKKDKGAIAGDGQVTLGQNIDEESGPPGSLHNGEKGRFCRFGGRCHRLI